MVVGNPTADSKQARGLVFVCLENKGTRFPELASFPTGKCKGGIMTVHHFPAYVITTIAIYSLIYFGQLLGWKERRLS
jgi:hypothetical protein